MSFVYNIRDCRCVSPNPDHVHLEGPGEPRKTRTDRAHANDENGATRQFILPRREVGNHASPMILALMVTRVVQLAHQRQHQGHRMIADRVDINATRIGEADGALRHRRLIELIVAGRTDLDEF